jgi:hypothetical protein
MNRFRAADRQNFELFQGTLNVVGNYLPLDFIFRVFNHIKKNPEGYDHAWLYNALRATKDLSQLHSLPEGALHVMYAVTMLMEAGRTYDGSTPTDAAGAFAVVFLSEHAGGFFSHDELQTIYRVSRRVSVMNLRPSVDTTIAVIANEVRLLTDVLYPDPTKMVVELVRNNSTPNLAPMEPDEWCQALAHSFAERFGRRGTAWKTLPVMVLNNKQEQLRNFQLLADDENYIGELVKNNYNRIFAHR